MHKGEVRDKCDGNHKNTLQKHFEVLSTLENGIERWFILDYDFFDISINLLLVLKTFLIRRLFS